MIKDQMERIYRSMSPADIPWNMESPPALLESLCVTGKISPCTAIELGCGLGNCAMYLARRGFAVTGVDIACTAIEIAEKIASNKGVPCRFITADVLGSMDEIRETFDFAFDWELLHHIFPEERKRYIENVNRLVNPAGYYLSVSFSAMSDQFGGVGKYRRTPLGTMLYFSSEEEIDALVSSRFKIVELKTVDIEGKAALHKAVYALATKQ